MRFSPSREIVVCCDGTNNTLTGGVADTNVVRLYEVLAQDKRVDRVMYYDRGVGSPDAIPPAGFLDWIRHTGERLSALASGRGVYQNIARAYIFLMHQYRSSSDEIYLFGFSRGAFTARAVAGMVNLFGVIRPEHESIVPTLVSVYFSPTESTRSPLKRAVRWLHRRASKKGQEAVRVGESAFDSTSDRNALAAQVRRMFASEEGNDAWVHFVGVWDTVESVGLPGPLSRNNPGTATLHDKRIRHVRHALSLDEHRWTFEPRLYEEPGDIDGPEQTLKQRWFPGAHCDVGGSYPVEESRLSDAALTWILEELRPCMREPLPSIDTDRSRSGPDALSHDPLWSTPWWALAGMTLRQSRMTHIAREDYTSRNFGRIPVKAIEFRDSADNTQGTFTHRSVWEHRRSFSSFVWAAALASLFLFLSGRCLLPDPEVPREDRFELFSDAVAAASHFAGLQASWLSGSGLLAEGSAPWTLPGQPGWAMFWDLAFIVAYGYLVARITSRAFAMLAGLRSPAARPPAWRWLGLAPLILVGADIMEDLLTLASMGAHDVGSDVLAIPLLWLTGVASLIKFVGLAGCAALFVVRYWLSLQPFELWHWDHWKRTRMNGYGRNVRHWAGDVYFLAGIILVLAAAYGVARAGVCWGHHGWGATILCNAHILLGILVVIAALWAFVSYAETGHRFGYSELGEQAHSVATIAIAALMLLGFLAFVAFTEVLL